MKIDLHDNVRIPFYQRISYLYLPVLFVLTSIILEVIMFALMRLSFPSAFIFSLAIMLVIAAVIALLRNQWVQMVICSLLLGWQLTTTIANIIANDTCMEIFSLETLKTLGMAFGNAGAIELGYWFLVPIIALIIIYIVAVVLIMWFCRAPKGKHVGRRWQIILCGLLAFVSFFSYTIAYTSLPNYQKGTDAYVANLSNTKFLYDTFNNRVSSLRKFGSYSYYLDNFLKLIGAKSQITDVMDLGVKDFQANEFKLPTDQTLGEGYNLIMILMETFERAAVNPVTMPNLYNFMRESCYEVDGYYSIERTCFTDHIGQTGMHVSGKELWNNYGNVTVPHALANIFKRSDDYTANAFHDYDGRSYNREEIFTKRLGFDSFTDFNDYETKRQTAHCGLNSDYDLFTQNLTKIAPADQNFYSYIVSVSTHSLNASWFNLRDYYPEAFDYIEATANWEKLTQLYPILTTGTPRQILTAKNYLAGTYNFDQGFGALLNRLKTTTGKDERLLIETTALVMFGDHYYYVNPFALKPENDDPRTLLGNRCPLIVYNPQAKIAGTTMTQAENAVNNIAIANPELRTRHGETLYRFTSTMDLYPTVCSLFGVETDQQLTYGHSIFDSNPSIGVGYLGGFTWGVTNENPAADIVDGKVDWHIWRTLDFVNYAGESLTKTQLDAITPLVNRTYASIYLDTALYDRDGFKHLAKSQAYHLRTI